MEDIHGETNFYHEDTLPAQVNSPLGLFDKDGFHLNLQTPDAVQNSRRLEQLRRNNIPTEISSPGEFNFLKLASPDLEKMLLAFQSAGNETPPNGVSLPAIPPSALHQSESVESTKGLAEALQDLHDRQELHGTQLPIVHQLSQDSYMENTAATTDQLYLTTDSSGAITVTSARTADQHDPTNTHLGSFGSVMQNTNDNKLLGATYVLQQFPPQNAGFMPAANSAPAQIYTPAPLSHPVEEMTHDTNAQLRALTAYNNVLAQNLTFPSQVYKLDGTPSMFAAAASDGAGLEPIDLEVQELVKRERKKQRNRVASSKCRKRKLEKEAVLEVTVKQLKARNVELAALENTLKQQICELKQRVMDHVSEGCPITLQHVEDPSKLFGEHAWDMTAEQT